MIYEVGVVLLNGCDHKILETHRGILPFCEMADGGEVLDMGAKSVMVAEGAAAGGLATLCMSVVMLLSKRLGIQGELPPRRITKEAVKAAGKPHLIERKLSVLTAATHMGFGAGSGAAFAVLPRARSAPVLQGMAYGVSIWFLSYKGIFPALGLMPEMEHDRLGRVWTNMAAHLVYGAVLAGCLEWFERAGES